MTSTQLIFESPLARGIREAEAMSNYEGDKSLAKRLLADGNPEAIAKALRDAWTVA